MRRTKSDPKVFQRFKTKVAEKVNQLCFETETLVKEEKFDSKFMNKSFV
jgi:hypothetical protein